MKDEMARIVEAEWHPFADQDGGGGELDAFGTNDKQNAARGDYFLDSADKVHFFAEPAALAADDEEEKTKQKKGGDNKPRLRSSYRNDKVRALNKAGHGLHLRRGVFRDYCLSDKIRNLVVKDLGWRDPVVPQSMYIFKQAEIGGCVTSHQDSTFLFTTPFQSCLGLWLALDDATLDNGCLWVRPYSHREPVRRQYKRNPEHPDFRSNTCGRDGGNQCRGNIDDEEVPKLTMHEFDGSKQVAWEGSLPGKGGWKDLLDAGFLPVECRAGDLLAFGGELDHLSLPNISETARHTFQLHLVEGPAAGVTWSDSNWLQYPFAEDDNNGENGTAVDSHSSHNNPANAVGAVEGCGKGKRERFLRLLSPLS